MNYNSNGLQFCVCTKYSDNMVKAKKYRKISNVPNSSLFRPFGGKVKHIDEIVLNIDEFEALRLGEVYNLKQKEAAKRMWISQSTFNRLISSARRKIANAIVNGKTIRIEGKR